ncbi:MRG domain-containing protein, partial [Favolaschia claudopus]
LSLPRRPTIENILASFRLYMNANPEIESRDLLSPSPTLTPVVVDGVLVYFNRYLWPILLYSCEREQYIRVRQEYVIGCDVAEEQKMSQVYGAEHLLRLINHLPRLVSYSTLDSESTNIIEDYANRLLSWMLQEHDSLFQALY